MGKLDKAELKKQGATLKETIAQARKKTLNFALLQGKDQMFLVTHLKKNAAMLRKEAKKEGGGPKGCMGTLNVDGKNLIFSVEDEPPGPFPKLVKKHFMTRGIAIRVTFKLPDGSVLDDGEPAEEGESEAPKTGGESEEESKDLGQNLQEMGEAVWGFFGELKDDLDDKMTRAGEDARKAFQDMSDQFEKSHQEEKFEEAQGYLDHLKKQLDDFVDDVVEEAEDFAEAVNQQYQSLKDLPSDIQKRIDLIIAQGVAEAEIQKKSAEENVKSLVDLVLAGVEEAKDMAAELLEPARKKIAEMIAAYQKYQADLERLKDVDLTDEQANDLAMMAMQNPKAFEAAVATLKSMDGEFGDLVATPKGIADLKAKKAEVQKLADAENIIFNAKIDAMLAAEKEVEAAKKAQTAAEEKAKKTEMALKKLKAKLPDDLATLSPTQKAALAKVINLLKADRKAIETAKADVTTKEATHKTANDTFLAQSKTHSEHTDKTDAAANAVKAAEVKKKMLDSLAAGPMAPGAKNPMSDEDIAKVLTAVEADPGFGGAAIDLLETTNDRSNVAKGAGMLADGIKNQFADKNGDTFGDKESSAVYAKDALKMGSAMGGSYFDDLQGFVHEGGLTKEQPLSFSATPKKKLEQERANHVSGAMLDENGKIDTKSQKAVDAMNLVNFHPDLLANATPGMNMHFADMIKTMEDPEHKQKCQDALDGITQKPQKKTGRDLVSKATGTAPDKLTKDDTKKAVMSAMFTPLNQGPVGSCFATGPARNVREKDPARVMRDMAQIATKGTFTTAQGVPIKAVRTSLGTSEADKKTNKLPENDNPLMRSWEYTVATAGAQLAGSVEEKDLDTQLWTTDAAGDPNGKNLNALKDLDGMDNWTQVKADLKTLIHDELDFRYNSTSEIEKSADGSSENGNFEIHNNGGSFPPAGVIITKDAFIKIISSLAIKAAKAEANPELSAKITAHCSSNDFIDSVCMWTKGTGGKKDDIRKPWEIGGGGFGAPMVKVLEGGNPRTTDILGDNVKEGQPGHESSGARTKKIVGAVMTNFIGQDPDVDMVNLTTGGIHVFEGLPNHPSLDKLKEGDDPAAAMEKYLLEPGKKMAETDVDEKMAGVMFDKQMTTLEATWMPISGKLVETEKGPELIEKAREKRPETAMTPKELKALIDAASKPVTDYQNEVEMKAWKDKETAAGNVPSAKDVTDELEKYKGWGEGERDDAFSNNVINALEPPEFVIADTNWGDGEGHTFFVVIPDPVSGEPKMFKKEDPSGKLTAVGDKWLDTNWRVTK